MTSAPKSERMTAAAGPAMKLAKSTTFNPEKMFSVVMRVSLLASLELRRTLFEKCRGAFLLVFRARAESEVGGLERQPLGLRRLHAAIHGLERVLHAEGRVGEDALEDRFGAGDQLGGGDDLVHEADAVGLL